MGVALQVPPPLNYEGELDFDDKAWASAREKFLAGRRAQKKRADTEEALHDFLAQSCSPQDARTYVTDVQKEKPQYQAGLGAILTKIDAFMKVGDLAIKSAPESIGLAWAGIRLCLHSVQDDFATFSQYNDACGDMIGILINCTVYGGMYGKPHGAKILEEIHRQVLDCIPDIYAGLLEFNYSMRKHTQTNRGLRIITGTYKSAAAKYKDKFAALKANERKMRDFAATASQQLTQYYQEIGLENDAKNIEAQMSIIGSLASIDASIREAFKSQEEHFRRLEDAIKDSKKQTPFEKAQRVFEQNVQNLEHGMDSQNDAFEETLHREPGTCQWIFKEEDYREWHTSEKNSILWVSANGGFGKSFLMGSIIETLKKSELQDNNVTVNFFFCKRGNETTSKSERIKKSILYQLYQLAKDNPDLLEEANRLVSSLDSTGKSKKDNKRDGKGAKSQLESNKKTATFVEVYQGLARLMKKTIFLIIDALDEIDDRVDQTFLEDFRSIVDTTDIKIHVIFGSRPGGDIDSALKGVPIIDVQGRNEADIRLNVTTLVGQLSGFSASERLLAVNDIVMKAGGQFRYVKPALDFLRLPWSRPLETRLKQLQKGLTNSYTQALQLTDPNYIGLLKTSLTWALLGEGQVTVKEVMDAFSCTFGQDQDDQDVEDIAHDEQPLKQVEQAGNTFLDVNWETGVIAPRHETVTDYFLNHETEEGSPSGFEDDEMCPVCKKEKHGDSRPFRITRKEGHLEIATTILQNLNSPAFWRKHFPDEYWKRHFPEVKSFDLKKPEEDPEATALTELGQKVESEEEEKVEESKGDEELNDASADPAVDSTVPVINNDNPSSEKINGTDPNAVVRVNDSSEAPTISLIETNGTVVTDVADKPLEDGVLVEKPNGATEDVPIAPEVTGEETEGTTVLDHEGSDENKDSLAPPEEDVADDASDADSDLNVEQEDWGSENRDVPAERYEVSHCMYHLRKVEEYWKRDQRTGPEFERFRALMKAFFNTDSAYFKRWITIQTGMPTSCFYWDNPDETHPLSVGGAYGITEILDTFLNVGDENKPSEKEINRALHNAAIFYSGDNVAGIKILLENGGDPNSTNHGFGAMTPFQMLVYRNHKIPAVNLFLQHGAKVDQANEYGGSPMHYLGYSGDNEDMDVLTALLENGGDVNVKDTIGETPLHLLVRRRDPPLDLLRGFIAKGANVNENDKEEQKPLYEVCTSGNVEAARILLEAGADIHATDLQGTTALHAAATGGHTKTCQLLIETSTADMTKVDKRNRTPFLLACGSDNPETPLYLATQIKEQDTSIFSMRTDTGKTPLTKAAARGHTEVVKMLLQKPDVAKEINEQDKKRLNTPLHVASMNGSKDIVELLLQHGASTTILDKRGNTPFNAACRRWAQSSSNDAGALILLMDQEPLDSLLANTDLLNTAAMKGNIPVLAKLLDKGASLNQQDEHGWTPLQLASQYGHTDAVKLLSERGAVVGRRPTRWKCDLETVKISEDGKTVEYIALDRSETGVLSDHPIPAGVKRYYYEISITEPGGEKTDPILGLGLCNPPAKTTSWMPGWPNKTSGGAPSWGYHGDDGNLFTSAPASKISEHLEFAHFGHGDVMGCAVDFERGEIFYTRNGERLETAFKEVRGRLHPVLGMGARLEVRVNFGEDVVGTPFRWGKANTSLGGWVD